MSGARVRGAGGGGSGAYEAPDTLRSNQIAEIVDLLGEGEWHGLTKGLQSIYLDGVPLQRADGTYNFDNVQVSVNLGTQGQPAITGGDGVLNEVGVAVIVTKTTPVVRAIINPTVDKVRITIEVPQLSQQTGDGDLLGSTFEWAVDVESAGGGYVEMFRDVVAGKGLNSYTKTREFTLPGVAPWNVRVRRITDDSGDAKLVNAFRWLSYTEVQSLKLRHPNAVEVRLRFDASTFTAIPKRAYDAMALKVRIPTNYDPYTKTYTGVWDGTFKVDWTDCPPWHFFDAVTHNRYGLGRYFQVNEALKWWLYEVAQYCDAMVPDGRGGMEPRFRAGFVLREQEQAYKVMNDLAAIFRGMVYHANDSIYVSQDAPAAPVAHFTNANVVNGRFLYSGTSRGVRPNQVVVWFNDITKFGELEPEVVVDTDRQSAEGVISKSLSPIGIWSRGQARRAGLWYMYTERYEGRLVNFQVGLDGALVAPGRIFEIADRNQAGVRLGGRIKAATTGQVTLDAPLELAPGESYVLRVMLPDPTDATKLVPQERAITTPAGTVTVVNVSPTFTQAPAPDTVWVAKSAEVETTLWRCLAVSEVEGTNDFELVGMRHYPQKYALVEQGIQFEPPSVSRIRTVPPPPATVSIVESIYRMGNVARSRATVSWPQPIEGLRYEVTWRHANGVWNEVPQTTANCVDVDNLGPGLFEVRVRSRNALGNPSRYTEQELALTGDAAPGVRVAASVQSFSFDAAGSAQPNSQVISLVAEPQNLAGAVAWTATGYDAAGTSLGAITLTGTGLARSMSVAAFGAAAYAVVQVSIAGFTGQLTISRVAAGGQASPVFIYQRAVSAPALPSAVATFTFATGAIAGLNNGWSATVPAGTDPIWVSTAQAFGSGTSDTIAAAEWATPRVFAQNGTNGTNGAAGANGLNNALVYIYQRAASAPALPSAVATYTFASGVLSGLNNGWSATPPAGSSPLWVSVATASSSGASDTIAGAEWAPAVVLAQDGAAGAPGSNGANGGNAASVYIYRRAASTPSLPASDVTFTFATGGLAGLTNSWTATIPAGTDPLWVSTATAFSSGASDTITPAEWAAAQVLAQNGANGSNGAPGANGLSNALVYIYQRAASAPALPSATATYTFASGVLSGLNNGWSATPPAGSSPLWVSVATASSAGATDTITSGEWASAVVLAQDGAAGAPGSNGTNGGNAASVYIFQRAASAPALPSATVTFTFSTGALSGLNNGWSASVPAGSQPLWVSTATAFSTGTSDTIGSAEWAPAQVLAQNGADGAPGTPGTSVFLATVYIAASSAPAAPAGGSFNFSTGVLTPPSSWSVTEPSRAPGQVIYAATFNFLTTTPGATVAGGTWSTPVATTSGAVFPGPEPATIQSTAASGAVSAAARFRPDGSIQQSTNSAGTVFANVSAWHAPVGGTPGAGFWIRFTTISVDTYSGTVNVTGSGTGWLQLNADRTCALNSPGVVNPSDGAALIRYEIATDAAGVNRATSGTLSFYVSTG